MKTIKIYWNDLTEEKKQEILNMLGENCNWDVLPMAIIEIQDDEEENTNGSKDQEC